MRGQGHGRDTEWVVTEEDLTVAKGITKEDQENVNTEIGQEKGNTVKGQEIGNIVNDPGKGSTGIIIEKDLGVGIGKGNTGMQSSRIHNYLIPPFIFHMG